MRKRSCIVLFAILTLAFVSAVGVERCTIADLLRDPSRYQDKEVSISGRVVDSYGVMGNGAYQVDDGTGRLWVIAAGRGVPSRDARVEVSGSLQETATIKGKSVGTVLHEMTRHRRSD